MTKMFGYLGLHGSLQQLFGQLLQKPGIPDQIFRILVILHQGIEHFFRDGHQSFLLWLRVVTDCDHLHNEFYTPATDQDSIDDLDAPPAGAEQPQRKQQSSTSYARNSAVRDFVLKRAKGCCEYCNEKGFLMADGKTHYLEAHHIIALANEGPDTTSNVIALCPKHHKEAHYGANRDNLEREMIKVVSRKQD